MASSNALDAYATDIVSGRLPAGKYHRLACARHLKDRAREGTLAFPYRLDLVKADRLFRFAEQLQHYKGQWAGQRIRLEPWQRFILGSAIGWVHIATGLRRFRTAFHQVPRKNGKSLTAAIVLLYLTFFDGEAGAEGYAIATKRDQSKIVFGDCKQLVQSSGLKDRIKTQVANLHRVETASKLEPLGADHDSTDGLNPNVVCVDEMHAMKDRGMLDVMETATGARRQPMIYEITTFGSDPVSPWGDQNDYANKILEGVLVDESFFAFTAHADDGDDWTLPETARKANPNYGISVSADDLASKVLKAKGIPSAAATYKQKHLNLMVNASSPCLSVDGWRKGQNPTQLTAAAWLAELEHEPCYAGIDLASKLDLCSLTLLFPPTVGRTSWRLIQHIWTPDETLVDRAHRDRAPYDVWVEQGWLKTTDGPIIDKQPIRAVLADARERYDLELIGFDPWHADDIIGQLVNEDGFSPLQVLTVPQTYAGMSSAEARFQAEVVAAQIDARGCPVTAWAVSNVVNQEDGKGNIFFTKKKSRGRIDPVKSATIAMALKLRQAVQPQPQYQILVMGSR
jgi:phage terminase large subunit-like protein